MANSDKFFAGAEENNKVLFAAIETGRFDEIERISKKIDGWLEFIKNYEIVICKAAKEKTGAEETEPHGFLEKLRKKLAKEEDAREKASMEGFVSSFEACLEEMGDHRQYVDLALNAKREKDGKTVLDRVLEKKKQGGELETRWTEVANVLRGLGAKTSKELLEAAEGNSASGDLRRTAAGGPSKQPNGGGARRVTT